MIHTELALLFAPQDMMLIFAIGFLLFGPKRLPEIGEALGKTVRAFREGSSKMMDELSRETHAIRQREAGDAHPNTLAMPQAEQIAPPHVEAVVAPTSGETLPEHESAAEALAQVEVVHGEVLREDGPVAEVHSPIDTHSEGHNGPQAEVLPV